MAEVATYKVEACWTIYPEHATSTILEPVYGANAYDDLTADVKSVSIRRGRSSDQGSMQQGTCTVRLKDWAGKYNAENAGSVLAGHLEPIRPFRVTAAYPTTELLTNGGFETAGAGDPDFFANWNEIASDGSFFHTTTAAEVHSGTYAAKLTAGPSTNTEIGYSLGGLTVGKSYLLSFWSRGDGTHAGWYYIYDSDAPINLFPVPLCQTGTVVETTYQKVTVQFRPTTTGVTIYLRCPNVNGGVAYFDDVSVTEGAYLFSGNISRIEHDPEAHESTIEAVDQSWYLDNRQPTITDLTGGGAALTNKSVSYILALITAHLGYPTSVNDFDGGSVIATFQPDGSESALSLISGMLEIDRGLIFFSRDGRLTYRDKETLYGTEAVVATFTDQMVKGLRATITGDDIVNYQIVTRTGGAQKDYLSYASWWKYGERRSSPITSDYIVDDAQSQALANFIVALKGNAQSPARSMTMVNGDATRLTQMLAREIGDYVTVSESAGGTSFSGWISSIEHEIARGGQVHRATFAIQKRTLNYMLNNGGFESDLTGWGSAGSGSSTITTTAGEFHAGAKALKITQGAGLDQHTEAYPPVEESTDYLLQFWTRGDGTNAGRYSIWDSTNGAFIVAATSTGITSATWGMVVSTFTAPAGCATVAIVMNAPAGNGQWACFDDVQMYRIYP